MTTSARNHGGARPLDVCPNPSCPVPGRRHRPGSDASARCHRASSGAGAARGAGVPVSPPPPGRPGFAWSDRQMEIEGRRSGPYTDVLRLGAEEGADLVSTLADSIDPGKLGYELDAERNTTLLLGVLGDSKLLRELALEEGALDDEDYPVVHARVTAQLFGYAELERGVAPERVAAAVSNPEDSRDFGLVPRERAAVIRGELARRRA